MTDKEPQRLKASGDTPEEVVRALGELGRDGRDAARLARVAERLEAPFAASAGGTSGWLGTLTGTKAGLTGLMIGLGALGLLGYQLAYVPEASRAKVPPAPAAATTGPPHASRSEQAPVERREQGSVEAPAPPVAAQERAPAPPEVRPAERRSARAREGEASLSTGGSAVGSSLESTATDNAHAKGHGPVGSVRKESPAASNEREPASSAAVAVLEEPQAESEERDDTPATAADVEPPSSSPRPTPRLSEAALLHRARKVAAREPQVALRLLEEHLQRFPAGMLEPERELLAIEVLRRLGRKAEAERRLRRFEDQHPRSLHRRRLEGQTATDD